MLDARLVGVTGFEPTTPASEFGQATPPEISDTLVPRRSACHAKCNLAWSHACALQLPSAKRSRTIAAAKSGRFESGAVNEADLRGSIIGCFDRTTHRVHPDYATLFQPD